MSTKNNHIIKAVACLVEAYQGLEGNGTEQGGVKYLLGQTIRQYAIPAEKCHVSKAAMELWNELTSSDIRNFWYREAVKCDRLEGEKILPRYVGSKSEPEVDKPIILHHDSTFCFRDVFHGDHVVPVSLILDELVKLDCITIENVQAILDKMHVCRILKSEDRQLGRTHGRTLDFEETIRNVYLAKNVELYNRKA